jgi:hypothetical protein
MLLLLLFLDFDIIWTVFDRACYGFLSLELYASIRSSVSSLHSRTYCSVQPPLEGFLRIRRYIVNK